MDNSLAIIRFIGNGNNSSKKKSAKLGERQAGKLNARWPVSKRKVGNG